MADGIAGGPATPAMRLQDNNSILGNFLHWVFVGNRPGAGLDALPGQLLQSFNPTTKAGLANLATMFVPGGDHPMEGPAYPGRFQDYQLHQAALDGHLSSDQIPHSIGELISKAKNSPNTGQAARAGQMVHDQLFGGEVHAKGPIPTNRIVTGKSPAQIAKEYLNSRVRFTARGEDGSKARPMSWSHDFVQAFLQDARHNSHPDTGMPEDFGPQHAPNFHEGPHGDGFQHSPHPGLPQWYHDFLNNTFAKSDHNLDKWLGVQRVVRRAASDRANAGAEQHFFSGHPGFREYGLNHENTGTFSDMHYAHDPHAEALIHEAPTSKAASARNAALARLLHQHGLGPHARN